VNGSCVNGGCGGLVATRAWKGFPETKMEKESAMGQDQNSGGLEDRRVEE
jgi:hypothetical protein